MICQLLLLSVQTLTITTFFYGNIAESNHPSSDVQNRVLPLSRGISVLVLVLYALWLVYSSRPTLYERFPGLYQHHPTQSATIDGRAVGISQSTDTMDSAAPTRRTNDDKQGNETCLFSISGAAIILILSITLLAFNTQFTTDSIQGLLLRRHVSQTFLSLIILPLLSVDPMSLSMAMQDKMDMSILLTVERCMQTSLLIAPLTVIIGAGMGSRRMDLHFDSFSLVVLFLSVILVIHVMQGGKSNW